MSTNILEQDPNLADYQTTNERITALETKVESMLETDKEISAKLDELLTFRNKGVGAFWLASSLMGTGMVGGFLTFIDWMRG